MISCTCSSYRMSSKKLPKNEIKFLNIANRDKITSNLNINPLYKCKFRIEKFGK
jgi:hypothetical protein